MSNKKRKNDGPRTPTLNLVDLQESQFAALYTGKIEPILKSKEGPRIEAVRLFWQRGALGTVGTGAATAAAAGEGVGERGEAGRAGAAVRHVELL